MPDEGQTIIPEETAADWLADQVRTPLRRVAEVSEPYRVDDPVP